jgi:hypothetical protein
VTIQSCCVDFFPDGEADVKGLLNKAKGQKAITAHYDRRRRQVVVELDSGLELRFRPSDAEELQGAKPADLATIEITPSGFGLYWPRVDADVSIPGLLQGIFGSRKWQVRRSVESFGKNFLKRKGIVPDDLDLEF